LLFRVEPPLSLSPHFTVRIFLAIFFFLAVEIPDVFLERHHLGLPFTIDVQPLDKLVIRGNRLPFFAKPRKPPPNVLTVFPAIGACFSTPGVAL